MPQMSPLNWLYLYFIFLMFICYFFLMIWYYFNLIVIKKEEVKVKVVLFLNKW